MNRKTKYNTPYVNMKSKLLPGHRYCDSCLGTCIFQNAFCLACKNGQVLVDKDPKNRVDVLYTLAEYLALSCDKSIEHPELIRKEIGTSSSPEDFLRIIENYGLYSPEEKTDICDFSYAFVAKALATSIFSNFS